MPSTGRCTHPDSHATRARELIRAGRWPSLVGSFWKEDSVSANAAPGGNRRGDFWKGVAVGAAAVVLLVLLLMAGMMAFGHCPMCGRGMMGGMM